MRQSATDKERHLVAFDFGVVNPVLLAGIAVETKHPIARRTKNQIAVDLDWGGLKGIAGGCVFIGIKCPDVLQRRHVVAIDLLG